MIQHVVYKGDVMRYLFIILVEAISKQDLNEIRMESYNRAVKYHEYKSTYRMVTVNNQMQRSGIKNNITGGSGLYHSGGDARKMIKNQVGAVTQGIKGNGYEHWQKEDMLANWL